MENEAHLTAKGTHEQSDVSTRLLIWFLILLTASGIATYLVIAGFWKYLDRQYVQPSTSQWAGPREFPPEPRLQIAPEADLKMYIQKEREVLQTYGWADEKTGTVRVPIDRAIELLAEQGVPQRKTSIANSNGRLKNEPRTQ